MSKNPARQVAPEEILTLRCPIIAAKSPSGRVCSCSRSSVRVSRMSMLRFRIFIVRVVAWEPWTQEQAYIEVSNSPLREVTRALESTNKLFAFDCTALPLLDAFEA